MSTSLPNLASPSPSGAAVLPFRKRAPEQLQLVGLEPEIDWREQAERMEALTSTAAVQHLVDRSLAAITTILTAGHTVRVAYSSGKDSTLLACLTLEAARRLKAAGGSVPDIHIVSADTGIENPEVVALLRAGHSAIASYARYQGLTVHLHLTQPRLSERWWVRIIGGVSLPSYIGMDATCSVDMKIKPMSRLTREMDRDLAAQGLPASVTFVGTRFDESSARAAHMRQRGESDIELSVGDVGGVQSLMLSPICHWPTEAVWAYLQDAGSAKRYPGYAESFRSTSEFYDAAAGGGCILFVDRGQKRASGCSARSGCSFCQRVPEDRSMLNMLLHPDYKHLRGLNLMQRYLQAIRWDLSRRRWIARGEPVDGARPASQDAFSAAECERLLRMVLTLDVEEAERAASHAQALASGAIADNERNRRLAEPQFQNLTGEDLVAIDYLWSREGLHPPHQALRICAEIDRGTGRMSIEVPAETPRSPVSRRIIRGEQQAWSSAWGIRDVALEMSHFDGEGLTYREDAEGVHPLPSWVDAPFWQIDPESLSLFFELEAARRIEETEGLGVESAGQATDYYLRLGLIQYPHSMRRHLDAARRGRAWDRTADLTTLAS